MGKTTKKNTIKHPEKQKTKRAKMPKKKKTNAKKEPNPRKKNDKIAANKAKFPPKQETAAAKEVAPLLTNFTMCNGHQPIRGSRLWYNCDHPGVRSCKPDGCCCLPSLEYDYREQKCAKATRACSVDGSAANMTRPATSPGKETPVLCDGNQTIKGSSSWITCHSKRHVHTCGKHCCCNRAFVFDHMKSRCVNGDTFLGEKCQQSQDRITSAHQKKNAKDTKKAADKQKKAADKAAKEKKKAADKQEKAADEAAKHKKKKADKAAKDKKKKAAKAAKDKKKKADKAAKDKKKAAAGGGYHQSSGGAP